ncbi:hypothetical protein H5410_046874 [Solanum commersonii]|uniref:Uncharacterized protein n=1 Tax=Solanum commersonii TaxID=4109 RepID=A0A9J5XHL9_SOLCO|nr:hypothetical protein H5410_046874 [Solanum commersonii]
MSVKLRSTHFEENRLARGAKIRRPSDGRLYYSPTTPFSRFRLFLFRSPLLRSPAHGFSSNSKGCPIRESLDLCLFSTPRTISSITTSFLVFGCLGIHRKPFLIEPPNRKNWVLSLSFVSAKFTMSNQNTQQALALPEKEVIQPHLPVTTSGMASSHSVIGGVYKARERIHHRMADRRLLAIPTSCGEVAAAIHRIEDGFWGLRSLRDLTQHLMARADDNHAPPVSAFPKAPLSFKRIRGMSSPGKVLRFASN